MGWPERKNLLRRGPLKMFAGGSHQRGPQPCRKNRAVGAFITAVKMNNIALIGHNSKTCNRNIIIGIVRAVGTKWQRPALVYNEKTRERDSQGSGKPKQNLASPSSPESPHKGKDNFNRGRADNQIKYQLREIPGHSRQWHEREIKRTMLFGRGLNQRYKQPATWSTG